MRNFSKKHTIGGLVGENGSPITGGIQLSSDLKTGT